MGGLFAEINMPCSSWDLRPRWQFNRSISATNVSHPILFMSNSRDPVTPLRNAEKMATKFPGSVVFGQDADGHATVCQPSRCIAKGVREYFSTGTLPRGGIACKPDRSVFHLDEEEVRLSQADKKLSSVLKALADLSHPRRFPLGI